MLGRLAVGPCPCRFPSLADLSRAGAGASWETRGLASLGSTTICNPLVYAMPRRRPHLSISTYSTLQSTPCSAQEPHAPLFRFSVPSFVSAPSSLSSRAASRRTDDAAAAWPQQDDKSQIGNGIVLAAALAPLSFMPGVPRVKSFTIYKFPAHGNAGSRGNLDPQSVD